MEFAGNLNLTGILQATGSDNHYVCGTLTTDELSVVGIVSASSFCGDGSNLSGISGYTDTDTLNYINSVGVYSSSAQIDYDLIPNRITNNNQLINGAGYTDCVGTVTGTGTSGYVPKWNGTTSQANSLIYDDGTCIGIGTATPAQKLHVVGTIIATGDVGAYYSSDVRLKENLEIIPNSLDKIRQINGYIFDWKDGGEINRPHRDMGIIAQEVQKIAPEVVAERDNGYLAVRYEKMIALLIEGIKELSKEIEELKKDK